MPRRPRGYSSTSSSTSIRTFSRTFVRTAMTDFAAIIRAHVGQSREAETRFLAELVKVPSDNSPGDCRAHDESADALMEREQKRGGWVKRWAVRGGLGG